MKATRWLAAAALGAALSLGLAARAHAVTDSVLVQVGGDLTGRAGSFINIPVTVDLSGAPGRQLGSYRGKLTWDPSVLEYVQLANGSFAPPQISIDSSGTGMVQATATLPAGASGQVTLFVARFYILSDSVPSNVSVSFDSMTSTAGSTPPAENLLPLLKIVPGSFCRSMGVWGDVSGDGEVNSLDALMTLSVVVGIPLSGQTVNAALADVDADGRITSRDALIMLSYAVGLPVTGFRVLLPAAGACATGAATTLAVNPDSIELAAGQAVAVFVGAADSSGRAVPVDSVSWVSSDAAVAGFNAMSGQIEARSAGLATLTVQLGPGIQGRLKVSVLARRAAWYADIGRAANAPVQLGSQALPFQYIGDALALARDGDTVNVAAGTYGEMVSQSASVTLLGDPANPPVIDPRSVPSWSPSYDAVYLGSGAGTAAMANLVVAAGGVYVTAHDLTVQNVTIQGLGGTSTTAGLDLYSANYTAPLDSRGAWRPASSTTLQPGNVLVSNVTVSGDALPNGILIEQADTATVVGSTVTRAASGSDTQCGTGPFVNTGILVRQASVGVVRGNVVTNPDCQGIGAFDYSEELILNDVGRATVSRNAVNGAPGTGIGTGARLVALDHNAVHNTGLVPDQPTYGYAAGIHATTVYTAQLSNLAPDSVLSVADTIVTSGGSGFQVDTAGSITIDSAVISATGLDYSYGGSGVETLGGVGSFALSHSQIVDATTQNAVAVTYGARVVRTHGNRIVNPGASGLYTYWSGEGGSPVDSVVSVSDTVLGAYRSGFQIVRARSVVVDSAVVDSAGSGGGYGNGVDVSDLGSSLSVRNSSLSHAYNAGIYGYSVPRMELLLDRLTGNQTRSIEIGSTSDSVRVFGIASDSTVYGLLVNGGNVLVDSSAFTNSDSAGIVFVSNSVGPWSGGRITRSRFEGNAGAGVARGYPYGGSCCATDSVVVRQSIFQGNLLGGVGNFDTEMTRYLDADSNYWGDPLGPQCDSTYFGWQSSCNPLSGGDMIPTSFVMFADWLGGPPITPAPPARRPVLLAARAPSQAMARARPAARGAAALTVRPVRVERPAPRSRAGIQPRPAHVQRAPWHPATPHRGIRIEVHRNVR